MARVESTPDVHADSALADVSSEWPTEKATGIVWRIAAAVGLVVVIAAAGLTWRSFTEKAALSSASQSAPPESVQPAEPKQAASAAAPVAPPEPQQGTLHVESTPSGALVILDGKEFGRTPLTIPDIPAGAHTLALQSGSGSITRRVNVAAGRTTDVIEALFSGWVHVSTPFEVQITEGARTFYLDDQNRILLPPGEHELTFDNQDVNYREALRVRVRPGETTQIVLSPSSSTLSVSASEPAEVFVDGERIGETPLATFPISLGTHDIVVRSASGSERTFTMTVTTTPVQLDVDFTQ